MAQVENIKVHKLNTTIHVYHSFMHSCTHAQIGIFHHQRTDLQVVLDYAMPSVDVASLITMVTLKTGENVVD